MGKVLWHTTMSLDGFIAGPGDAMDWVFEFSNRSPAAQSVIETTGAALVGRRSYDAGAGSGRPERRLFGGAWTGPQLVLTHDAPDAPPEDPTIRFLAGDIADAVATARDAAGDGNVLVIGADVARQVVQGGLMDEILVHLAPVLLGDGVRLYGGPGQPRIDLEPLHGGRAGDVTDLRFRVPR